MARLDEVKRDLGKSENNLKEFREKNRQVFGSPQLLLEQERLIREVGINSTICTGHKKRYEALVKSVVELGMPKQRHVLRARTR